MPTLKPRIAITLPDELYSTLDQIANLTGCAKSSLISEVLIEAAPIFDEMLAATLRIKAEKENIDTVMKEMSVNSVSHVLDKLVDFERGSKNAND